MQRNRWIIGTAAVFSAAVLTLLWFTPVAQQSTSSFAMGSVLTQEHWLRIGKRSSANEIEAAVLALESELHATEALPALAETLMEKSGGAFNPWLGALTALWNIDSKDGSPPHLPAPEEIAAALQQPQLNLGAYGKGAACDAALQLLSAGKTQAAVVNLGGNILTYGQKPWAQPFRIALRDPSGGASDTLGLFTLRGSYFISTSGSYEKFFAQDGKRYHHIFDPETGYPARRDAALISVTVLSQGEDGGAIGDMLSTACFVLGYAQALPLLEQYGCAAVFVYEDGRVCSAGEAMELFELTNASYRWDGSRHETR